MIRTHKTIRHLIILTFSVLLIISCKKASLPGVATGSVTRILQTSAYSGGQVTNDGGAQITARGICWNTAANPDISNNKTSDSTGSGLFTSYLTGLTANTLYYIRAYATNSEGTAYGEMVSFTTLNEAAPTVTTTGLKSVTTTSATSVGNISNDGGQPVTERGICWNTTGGPSITDNHASSGSGTGMYTTTLTDLIVNTTYHVRAYAINSIGTGYSDEVTFTQLEPVMDSDGNPYSVVTIGTQVWLGENLRTTKFNDGTPIPYVTEGIDWANTTTPAFCWYANSELYNKDTYGGLYNWYAANTGRLCPVGWHIPTADEFGILLTYLGGEKIAGGKLKETGTVHWVEPNLGATNGSGFTFLPGGGRYNIYSEGGAFADIGRYGYMWSNTGTTDVANAFSFNLGFDLNLVGKSEYSKRDGGSVRCLKNSK